MEKTEPTFIPEWLKSSSGLSTSSSLNLGNQGVKKTVRNKSLNSDLGRPSVSDRTTSSYTQRSSVSNGSASSRSYSSFNRNNRRDRDLDKDIYEFRNKERSENRHREYSDHLGNILPSRFGKDGLRRSNSSIYEKRGESWPRKSASDFAIANKSSHNNGSISSVKTSFEREFPSLAADEKQTDTGIGRVASPGLSSAIQSLPTGSSAVIGGDGWTSALAEVPVIVGSNGNGASLSQPTTVCATTGMTSGRNMAETLAQGPPRTQSAPQVAVGTQRLEELAVKQSRQLIPMTPSLPKALALNSSDKSKTKVVQSQLQSSHLVNLQHTPRPVSVKPEVSKAPTVGKLLVLKPSRERNGISLTAKESLSPTAGSKISNSPLALPSVGGPAPLSKLSVPTLEKRPSSQALSRSNFFKLMRKKSMSSNSSVAPEISSVSSSGKSGEPMSLAAQAMGSTNNGKSGSGSVVIRCSEEEEARFLRSLGWEDTAEEEGLTEEEISSFLQSYRINMKPASKILKVPKPLMPMGEISSNSNLES
uniref:uncharacterized protein LOC122592878 isoform X2 n=1 Tax=Erigeron canadensis TaxID=72917 RepID=UPI001CB98B9D|nr:uncharacterized protein LOC122592878 isoform X2 [Erigeron canadensis]